MRTKFGQLFLAQLALSPSYLIGMEDFTIPLMVGLGIEASLYKSSDVILYQGCRPCHCIRERNTARHVWTLVMLMSSQGCTRLT